MSVVGVDLSTHFVDLVKLSLDDDRAEWVRVPLVGENAIDRARSYRRTAVETLPYKHKPLCSFWWDDVILCALEDPAGRGDTRKIARVQGVVIATIPARVQVWTLQPAEWRKACGLPGNCNKEAVATFCYEKWINLPRQGAPQDCWDAYAIAYAARSINASAASVAEGNQTQEEAA